MLILIFILGFLSFVLVTEQFHTSWPKTWTYEIKSIESTSSNTDLLYVDFYKERVSRGVYAISGEFFLKFDIFENDGNKLGAEIYRSVMGDGVYSGLPYQLPPTDWIEYMNTFHKNAVMESVKDCSNFPYFTDKFVGPVEKKKYTLNRCQISQDGFPNHLEEGVYKLVFSGNGTVDWQVVYIVDIIPNI